MFNYTGKFLSLIKKDNLQKYDKVHLDVLWYLTHITQVNRLISRESIKEFLTRYFLICDINIDRTALDFINEGKLIEGTIETKTFAITVKDMMALNGFANLDTKFNVRGTLDDFIKDFKYKAPNIKLAKDGDENTITISKDALVYALLDLGTLLEIDSFSLKFKDDLKDLTEEEKQKAINFAEYVVSNIDDSFFENYESCFPGIYTELEERFFPNKKIRFDVYKDLDRKTLIEIYKHIITPEEVEQFEKIGTSDEDFVADLARANEHIVFAYGVKHGYIQLTYDLQSMHYDYSPYFDIDPELLMGYDFENYPSKDIYEMWNVEEWIHLLP